MQKLKCILLVDDNMADNRYHQIIIEEMNIAEKIVMVKDGAEALYYLNDNNNTLPEIIFLDINMPEMNGWEFLEEYRHLDPATKSKIKIVILSTSANPDDITRAEETNDVADFETKPLDKDAIENIVYKFF
ncbi:response regulator [bacterium]|nr:response regulator [bacterium]